MTSMAFQTTRFATMMSAIHVVASLTSSLSIHPMTPSVGVVTSELNLLATSESPIVTSPLLIQDSSMATDMFGSDGVDLITSPVYEDLNISSAWMFSDIDGLLNSSMVSAESTIKPSPTSASDMMFPSGTMSILASSSSSPTTATTAVTPSRATTTPKPAVTTTPDPAGHITCRSKLAPHAKDASFQVFIRVTQCLQVLVTGFLIYTCGPGFQQVGGSAYLRCGSTYGWVPRPAGSNLWYDPDIIQCQQLIFEKPPPPDPVPQWLVPMIIADCVLLALLILAGLLLFFFVRHASFNNHVEPWQPRQPLPPKKDQGHRGWPWKRPWRAGVAKRPLGHMGPDGVAWFVSDENVNFPVLRRYE